VLNLNDDRGLVKLMHVRGGVEDPLEGIDDLGDDNVVTGGGAELAHRYDTDLGRTRSQSCIGRGK
jgi:hypothetical protein